MVFEPVVSSQIVDNDSEWLLVHGPYLVAYLVDGMPAFYLYQVQDPQTHIKVICTGVARYRGISRGFGPALSKSPTLKPFHPLLLERVFALNCQQKAVRPPLDIGEREVFGEQKALYLSLGIT